MKAKSLEELHVWQRARKFADAISAMTRTPSVQRDARFRDQLNDCADSVLANIAEGFGQSTDRGFARYLAISKGSSLEAKSHLAVALGRRYISQETYDSLAREATEIVNMLSGLIGYLRRADWKYRV